MKYLYEFELYVTTINKEIDRTIEYSDEAAIEDIKRLYRKREREIHNIRMISKTPLCKCLCHDEQALSVAIKDEQHFICPVDYIACEVIDD